MRKVVDSGVMNKDPSGKTGAHCLLCSGSFCVIAFSMSATGVPIVVDSVFLGSKRVTKDSPLSHTLWQPCP